jgi:hypothetical protein
MLMDLRTKLMRIVYLCVHYATFQGMCLCRIDDSLQHVQLVSSCAGMQVLVVVHLNAICDGQ